MAGIPQAVLDEIRNRIDLVQLVSEHVALKPSGRGFIGLCPFHSEKTPSFHVDPQRGFFHCFGCNAGGNAFTFLMRVSGATFPEVARMLAQRAGVTIPAGQGQADHERLAQANALAADLFERLLWEGEAGARCREYLAGRGIERETARRFQLGYAPSQGWLEHLVKQGAAMADLQRVGLAGQAAGGRPYPLFRDRLVFPIHDLGGRSIAFGGRALAQGQEPKYLNSPESPLYRKGHHLFGLGQARDAIRERGRIVLVEGYLDAIALSQAGVTNVAAILGTALTVEQLRLAKRFSERVIVCFDGDAAGKKAALRAFPLCVNSADLWPLAVFLPPGDDPDSLVRRAGARAIEDLLDRSSSLVDVYLDELIGPDTGIAGTAKAAGKVASLLAGVQDTLIREKLLRGVAGRLGVSESTLLQAARASAMAEARAGGRAPATVQGAPVTPARVAEPPAKLGGRHFSAEAELVELVLCDTEIAARAEQEGVFREFADSEWRRLGETVLERRAKAELFDAADILGELPRDMAERVARRLSGEAPPEEIRRAGEEWFARRAARKAKAERSSLIARLRAAEHRGDQFGVAAALVELRGLGATLASTAPEEGREEELPRD